MSRLPLVTIIVNSYNYERYLREAIDSALGQTYPHLEVIVVDDGSTDSSPEIIRSYGDTVKALFKPNGGQGSSVNLAFEHCSGEIVMFLDSDDVLLPWAVERVVAAYRPGVSKIQFRLQVVDAKRAPIGRHLPPLHLTMPSGHFADLILKGKHYPSPPTSGNAFPRDVLDRLMPIPTANWRTSIDTYLFTLACLFGEVVSIAEPCGLYRVHGKNVWALGPNEFEAGPLANFLEWTFRREALIVEWAGKVGHQVGPHVALQAPGEVARLFALKLLDPDHKLVRSMRPGWIVRRGLAALVSDPFPPGLLRRLKLAAWFILAGLLPREAATELVRKTLFGQNRPGGTNFQGV